MEFRVLGPLEVRHGGEPLTLASGKQCAVLADLLLNANRAVSTARLVDDLWGDRVPETAVKAVQVYVSKLRKVLPEPRLRTRGSGYLLEVSPGELDLDAFAELADDGRAALAAGRPEEAADLLARALALWRGPALAEFLEPFAQGESARLEEVRVGCLEDRIDADLALGRHLALVPELEALVAAHPVRERARSQLILALYRSGRQAEALDTYQRFRRLLDDELGIQPTQALRDLELAILRQDTALDTPRSEAAPHGGSVTVPADVVAGPRERRPVGRERELEAVAQRLREALEGRRHTVFVTGEAGVGKTTLVEELIASCETDELVVARGQCVDNRGVGEPYLPVLDAVGRLGRGSHGQLVVEQLRRFAPTWLAQLPALVPGDEGAWLEQRVSGLTTERMLREMTEALEALAGELPVVLVLEDLHWSDPSTLGLVDAIARRPDPARLLVIGTARTGPEGATVQALARTLRLRNLASEVALGPLSPAAVAEYLDARMPGHDLPRDLADDVALRTRGVPLFVEKLVDSWLDGGAIEPDGDGWAAIVPVEQLRTDVPETLRELIAERVRPLEPRLRDLLEAASVVGTEFVGALVAAATGEDEEAVDELLADLVAERSLVDRRPRQRWADGTVTSSYAFTHDLVQETLYDAIPSARRARLHGRVGARLEQAHGAAGAGAAELAWHFTESGNAEQAVRHLLAAAKRAFEKTAAREAQGHVDAALALVPEIADPELRSQLELTARMLDGSTRILVEGFASANVEESLLRSVELARDLGDPTELASALVNLSGVYEICGRYSLSERVINEALALPADRVRPELVLGANELLACSLVHQGRHAQALDAADRALELVDTAEDTGSPVAVFGESPGVSTHVWAALALWHLGRPDSAVVRAEQAVAAAVVAPRAFSRGMAAVNVAVVSQFVGRPAMTRRWAEAGIEASERAGYPYWSAVASILRGWARAVDGDHAGGLAELVAALAAARATGARLDDPYFLALLADVHLLGGGVDEGLAAIEEALDEMRGERSFFCEPELHRLRGELLRTRGDSAGVIESFERAVEIAHAQGASAYELRATVSLARATREPSSGERLARLYASFSEGFDLPDLVAAREVLAELGVGLPTPPPDEDGQRRSGSRPAVRYADAGGLEIAYQVTGGGGRDIVLVPGFVSHLDQDWEEPRHAHFLDRLGSLGRLIRFDKRGTGLSDRPEGLPDLETRMDDVRAVMDAAGSDRAVVFGYSEGGPLSVLFAATYPERVEALVLFGSYAKRVEPDVDYPWAATPEARREHIDLVAAEGGFARQMQRMCPGADDTMARWWEERGRAAASPGAVRALLEMNSHIDVRDLLPAVHVPTLVVHRRHDSTVLVDEGRYLASRIPGARFVELDGADHFVALDPDQILDVVEPFVRSLSGVPAVAEPSSNRVLATMMFTDIVGSTETAIRLGDSAWGVLLDRHNDIVRHELARFGGEEIDTAGDGFLAVFDGPARAIRCGRSICERVGELDLAVRVGVHTGEVERSNGTLRGVAVHVAARVADVASADEVLVSATTRDLVAGSELEFVDRGEHALKGLDGARRLFAAVP